jgi:hypothetical protein
MFNWLGSFLCDERSDQQAAAGVTRQELRVWGPEIAAHDASGCPGTDFEEPWYGGLRCTRCGR